MSRARLLCILVVAALAVIRPARADELERFLGGMADSTSAWFGATSVTFDTTGVDSLLRVGGNPKLGKRSAFKQGLHWKPTSGFHRAVGHSLGLEAGFGSRAIGELKAGGSYGFSNHEGRYRFAYRRDLWRRTPVGDPELSRRLTLRAAYARETLPFRTGACRPLLLDARRLRHRAGPTSVYESRGLSGGLEYASIGLAGGLGYRAARDQSMPRATRETLWGRDRSDAGGDRGRCGELSRGNRLLSPASAGRAPSLVDRWHVWRARSVARARGAGSKGPHASRRRCALRGRGWPRRARWTRAAAL
ncbi:MAG: hypothetical protein U0527_09900 [Candidatus Eisenbacteria bacterium]